MLKPVLDIAVPALVILTMVAVGLGLTVDDFRRVVRNPRLVAAVTAGQLLFLPRPILPEPGTAPPGGGIPPPPDTDRGPWLEPHRVEIDETSSCASQRQGPTTRPRSL